MAKRLDAFVQETFEVRRIGSAPLEAVAGQRFLRASLGAGQPSAQLYLRASCLLASRGNLALERPSSLDLPAGILLATATDAAAGGGAHLFLASANTRVLLLRLHAGEEVLVNAAALLAFDTFVSVRPSTVQFKPGSAGGAGVVLQGPGMVALMGRGTPVTVAVEPRLPVLRVYPQMTLAWTTNVLSPDLRPALTLDADSAAGRSTEDIDNKFQFNFNHTADGNRGYVILQPNDDNSRNILTNFLKLLPTLGFCAFRIIRGIVTQGLYV